MIGAAIYARKSTEQNVSDDEKAITRQSNAPAPMPRAGAVVRPPPRHAGERLSAVRPLAVRAVRGQHGRLLQNARAGRLIFDPFEDGAAGIRGYEIWGRPATAGCWPRSSRSPTCLVRSGRAWVSPDVPRMCPLSWKCPCEDDTQAETFGGSGSASWISQRRGSWARLTSFSINPPHSGQ